METRTNLQNGSARVALVTGGARGIGEAIVKALVADGLAVAIADLRAEQAQETAQAVREAGGQALGVSLDVTDSASVTAGLELVRAELGEIDVLVNNAGWDDLKPFVNTDEEFWDRVIEVNFKGAHPSKGGKDGSPAKSDAHHHETDDGRLEPGHFFQGLGVALAFHFYFGRCGFDFAQILGGELDVRRTVVFIQARELGGAGDGHDPRLLRQDPGESDLRGRGFFARRDLVQQIHHGLIGLHRVRREARQPASEIGTLEFRGFVHGAGQKSFAQRAVGHEADAEFFECGQHSIVFRAPEPKRIFALHGGHRLHRVRSPNGLRAGFGHPEMFHFAGLN